MKGQIEIQWTEAVQQAQDISQEKQRSQAEALQEFKESNCDMFSVQDWMYYCEETGKTMSELRQIAKFQDTNTVNYYLSSLAASGDIELDELANINF